jgi:hypothetical protein
MALHICNCSYSTAIKCNFNKHIKICKHYEKTENEMYNEKLAKMQQLYDEKVAMIQKKCDEKLTKMKEKCKQEIYRIKSTHLRPRDEYHSDYIYVELIKECKKKNLEYTDDMSVDELRKIIHMSR